MKHWKYTWGRMERRLSSLWPRRVSTKRIWSLQHTCTSLLSPILYINSIIIEYASVVYTFIYIYIEKKYKNIQISFGPGTIQGKKTPKFVTLCGSHFLDLPGHFGLLIVSLIFVTLVKWDMFQRWWPCPMDDTKMIHGNSRIKLVYKKQVTHKSQPSFF